MFLTEEQLTARLENPRNLANRFKGGRHACAKEQVPESEIFQDVHQEGIQFREIKRPGNNRSWLSSEDRTRIATEVALASGDIDENRTTQTEVARRYSVQPSTVSDIVNNARRVPDKPRSVDQARIEAALDSVREKATNRLHESLDQLTTDKISAHNAKDISAICANMAKVVQQTLPQEKGTQNINLIVYTPELRQEKNFDSVEV